MSSVEVQDQKTLRRSIADARHHLEKAVRDRASEGALLALRGQIVELLDKLDRLHLPSVYANSRSIVTSAATAGCLK
jgi:ribosomal protein S15P/S13E